MVLVFLVSVGVAGQRLAQAEPSESLGLPGIFGLPWQLSFPGLPWQPGFPGGLSGPYAPRSNDPDGGTLQTAAASEFEFEYASDSPQLLNGW